MGFGRKKWLKEAVCRVRRQASTIVDDMQLHAGTCCAVFPLLLHDADSLGSSFQAVRQHHLQRLGQFDRIARHDEVVFCGLDGHLYTTFDKALLQALKGHLDGHGESQRGQRQIKHHGRIEEGA